MARPLRIEFDGAWYHVMNRGLGRRSIVHNNEDRRYFLSILGDTVSTFSIEVHSFSLMDNHYHLLIHTPRAGLSRAMRHLNGIYTQRVNKSWRKDGPVFRGRYKAILVDSDEYLTELVRYIHLNPVVAGLCTHPDEHAWTSHCYYVKKTSRPKWLVTGEVLAHFGKVEKKAMPEFDRFVQAGVPLSFRRKIEKGRPILGRRGFKEWVYTNFIDQEKDGVPLKQRQPQPKIPVRVILQNIGHLYNIPLGDIKRNQAGKKNDGRSMAAYLIRRLTGISQKEIARWLNVSGANTVAQMQYRFDKRLIREKRLRKLTNVVNHAILSTVKT